ncbi:hypothetical protein CAEBREN_04550 [Caenorhabditis brenneri]|uniref:Uncharacterized protein n=1 Tax=Caenorhabditis brenneri TaxID=135651 RepID=G0NDT6_CAEBE|nr:hypothetical protein CAEBREN_04550 [Caenorhabditis brenneri]
MNKRQRIIRKKKILQLASKLKKRRLENSKDDVAEDRFPLLRLPILAIQNCIRFLTVFQFLDFSLLSKRAKTIASTIRRDEIGINFCIDDESRIHLIPRNFPNKEWLIEFEMNMNILKKLVPRKINGTTMLSTVRTNTITRANGEKKTFHRIILPQDDIIETMKWMTEHLCLVFRSPIQLMSIEHFFDPFILFFKWLHTFQQSIDCIHIDGTDISTKSLLFILNNFQIKKELDLYVELSDNSFEYTKPVNTHSLSIDLSQWNLKNILCSENSLIALSNSSLTPEDINCLIKHWIGGWNKNLFYLEFVRTVEHRDVEEEVFNIITKDIEWREHSEYSGRPTHLPWGNGTMRPMYNGRHVEIERSDGRLAAFAQVYQWTDGKWQHHFRFQAWDKK